MARLDRKWKVEMQGVALATELHHVLEVSHRQAKGLLDAGCVKVNGAEVRLHGTRLEAGDEVEVNFDPATEYKVLPKARKDLSGADFELLWEDKHLLFVNKPAGLLTVPTETSPKDPCLADALTDMYQRRGFKKFKLYIVHRLDRYSSGVLVFAKTSEALHGLTDIFKEHHLSRIYKAILEGELPENAGVLTDKLLEGQRSRIMKVASGKDKENRFAKRAVTHYRVLERLPGHTLIEVKLETGRRNQIRVQFAERGFPLLGDQVYGKESPLLDRQALHAELLGFKHPVTGEPVTVQAPLPEDMETALRSLRARQRVARAEAGIKGDEETYQPKANKLARNADVLRARRFEGKPQEKMEAPDRRPGTRRSEAPESGRPRTKPADRPGRPRTEGDRPKGPRPFRKEGEEGAPKGPRGVRKPGEGDRPSRPRPFKGEGEEGAPKGPRGVRRSSEGDRPKGPRPFKREGEEGAPKGPRGARKFAEGDRPTGSPARREAARPARPEDGDRPRRPAFKRTEGDAPRKPSPRVGEAKARPAAAGGPKRPAFNRAQDGDARPARPRKEGGAAPRGTKPGFKRGPKKG